MTGQPRIASILIDERSLAPAGPDAEHERKVAIFDLLEENSFALPARDGRPGLRAEVRARNRGALAFYDRVGFSERGQGRYGLPWWGQVHLLHLSV